MRSHSCPSGSGRWSLSRLDFRACRGHWSGYGELQAKFRRQNAGTKDLEWLRGQLRAEFAAWLNPSSARARQGRRPEYLIVTTNARLTSVAGTGGIDQARELFAGCGNSWA